MNDFLEKLINGYEAEQKDLLERSEASSDADEVRSIGEKLDDIAKKIEEARGQMITDEIPNNVEVENMEMITRTNAVDKDMEYREAFKELCLKGTPIPAELRTSSTTTNAAAVIPSIVAERIVDGINAYGNILPLVEKTSYKGGVTVAVASGIAADWVNEGAGSTVKAITTTPVTFAYNKLRVELSMTMEVATMSVSTFEKLFVDKVVAAMVEAIEQAIIIGDGSGKPKGILAETTTNKIEVVRAAITYKTLCDAEALLDAKYEGSAKWCMSKKTFMSFIGMTDTNGQPIARVNYGIGGKPERYLLGREVVICNHVPTLASATANNFAFIFDFKGYMLNTIYDLGIQKKTDWDTEDERVKAVMSVDGKVIDKGSLVILANKTA